MPNDFSRRWWSLVLRGCAAIVFGTLAAFWPGLTLALLIVLSGVYALVTGVVTIAGALLAARREQYWWLSLLDGAITLSIGLVVVFWPGLTALALVTGATQLATAIRLRREIEGEWLLGLCGILSIVAGVAIGLFPRSGARGVVHLIGGCAVILGMLLVATGIKSRGWARRPAYNEF